MSLDKSIANGKEHRKPYRGSKAIDPSCRNHGGCPWCEENRKHKFRDRGDDIDSWLYPDGCNGAAAEEEEDDRRDAAPAHHRS